MIQTKDNGELFRARSQGSGAPLAQDGRDTQAPVEDETLRTTTARLLAELALGLDSVRNEGRLTVEEAFAGLEG